MNKRRLTNQELKAFAELSEHKGLKSYLNEMGEDGLENYDGEFIVYEGNVELEGSFETGDNTVTIIKGDMSISGTFSDTCNDGPSCTLILGNLHAKNAVIAGYIEIQGNMNVSEIIVGDYNDGRAFVKENLECAIFLPNDIHFEIKGELLVKEKDRDYDLFGDRDEYEVLRELKSGKSTYKPLSN